MLETVSRDRETEILSSFLKLVKSPYGDFSAIGAMSHALNDRQTLEKVKSFLSQTSQGKHAQVFA